MTSRTSISGMKLISGSSRPRVLRRFIAAPSPPGELPQAWALREQRLPPQQGSERFRTAVRRSPALAVREVDELDRLLLHLDVQAVDRRAEVAVEDHARNRDDQAERGVVQRDGDAVRELDRVRARRRLRTEDLDHADDRSEQ